MRKTAFGIVLLSSLVLCFHGVRASGETGAGPEKKYAPNEILVKYRAAGRMFSTQDDSGSKRWRGAVLRRFDTVGFERVRVRNGMTVEDALTLCRGDQLVEYAEPNFERSAFQVPNDTDFAKLWAMDNTGQTGGALDADIDAVEAWNLRKGSRDVIVAVLDTGADLDHVDLTDNIWKNPGEDWLDRASGDPGNNGVDDDGNGRIDDYFGWDFANRDSVPDDDYGHGSHVSGTIGAEGDNGTGVVGVNWRVSLMPLKFLDENGDGYVSDEIEAIEYAIQNGAMIVNASYGGSQYSVFEYEAVKKARDAGLLFVTSAGNGPVDNDSVPSYPAGYDLENIIAVAASDHRDQLASFTNYGALSVDVAAPGVSIWSTVTNNGYRSISGTSMAAAHVSGLAALIWSQDIATMTFEKVKERISLGVDVLPGFSGKILTAGRINAYNSLLEEEPSLGPEPPSGFSAQTISAHVVRLTWIDQAIGESGFKVFRAFTAVGPYEDAGTSTENAEEFLDTTARDGSTNYYKVSAFNPYGLSAASDVESAVTPLGAPSGLTAIAVSSEQIDLRWSDNSDVESGYTIEEKVAGAGGFTVAANVGANGQSYSRTGLAPATSYTYRVRTVNGDSLSDYSAEAGATTQAPPSSTGGGGGGGGCFIDTAKADGAAAWYENLPFRGQACSRR